MKHLFAVYLVVLSQFGFAGARVNETLEFSEIFQSIAESYETHGRDLLIVFDIDDTLIVTEPCTKKNGERTKGIGKFFHCPSEHTESITANGIANLQSEGIHTIALTARGKNLIKVTERELSREHHGKAIFNFKAKPYSAYIASVPVDKTRRCKASETEPCLKGEKSTHPRFQNGVFYAQGAHKGLALKELLKTLNVNYSKIVFVDDRSKNTQDVYEVFSDDSETDVDVFLYLRHRQ